MKQSAKIALCGVLAALSLVCMLATGLVPFATYALPGLAGVFLLPVVIQCGKGWAMGVYAVVSLLAFFLVPDREASLLYLAFLGYYPVLKAVLEQYLPVVWGWIAKFAAFNVAVVGLYFVALHLLNLPIEGFEIGGVNLPGVFLLAGNFVFLVYDRALSLLVVTYLRRIQPLLQKYFPL